MALKILGASIRHSQLQRRHLHVKNDILFSRLLPELSLPANVPEGAPLDSMQHKALTSGQYDPSMKRSFLETDETSAFVSIPKRARRNIPASASLHLTLGDEEGRAV